MKLLTGSVALILATYFPKVWSEPKSDVLRNYYCPNECILLLVQSKSIESYSAKRFARKCGSCWSTVLKPDVGRAGKKTIRTFVTKKCRKVCVLDLVHMCTGYPGIYKKKLKTCGVCWSSIYHSVEKVELISTKKVRLIVKNLESRFPVGDYSSSPGSEDQSDEIVIENRKNKGKKNKKDVFIEIHTKNKKRGHRVRDSSSNESPENSDEISDGTTGGFSKPQTSPISRYLTKKMKNYEKQISEAHKKIKNRPGINEYNDSEEEPKTSHINIHINKGNSRRDGTIPEDDSRERHREYPVSPEGEFNVNHEIKHVSTWWSTDGDSDRTPTKDHHEPFLVNRPSAQLDVSHDVRLKATLKNTTGELSLPQTGQFILPHYNGTMPEDDSNERHPDYPVSPEGEFNVNHEIKHESTWWSTDGDSNRTPNKDHPELFLVNRPSAQLDVSHDVLLKSTLMNKSEEHSLPQTGQFNLPHHWRESVFPKPNRKSPHDVSLDVDHHVQQNNVFWSTDQVSDRPNDSSQQGVGFQVNHNVEHENVYWSTSQELNEGNDTNSDKHSEEVAAPQKEVGLEVHHNVEHEKVFWSTSQELNEGNDTNRDKHSEEVAASQNEVGLEVHHNVEHEKVFWSTSQESNEGNDTISDKHSAEVAAPQEEVGLNVHHNVEHEKVFWSTSQELNKENDTNSDVNIEKHSEHVAAPQQEVELDVHHNVEYGNLHYSTSEELTGAKNNSNYIDTENIDLSQQGVGLGIDHTVKLVHVSTRKELSGGENNSSFINADIHSKEIGPLQQGVELDLDHNVELEIAHFNTSKEWDGEKNNSSDNNIYIHSEKIDTSHQGVVLGVEHGITHLNTSRELNVERNNQSTISTELNSEKIDTSQQGSGTGLYQNVDRDNVDSSTSKEMNGEKNTSSIINIDIHSQNISASQQGGELSVDHSVEHGNVHLNTSKELNVEKNNQSSISTEINTEKIDTSQQGSSEELEREKNNSSVINTDIQSQTIVASHQGVEQGVYQRVEHGNVNLNTSEDLNVGESNESSSADINSETIDTSQQGSGVRLDHKVKYVNVNLITSEGLTGDKNNSSVIQTDINSQNIGASQHKVEQGISQSVVNLNTSKELNLDERNQSVINTDLQSEKIQKSLQEVGMNVDHNVYLNTSKETKTNYNHGSNLKIKLHLKEKNTSHTQNILQNNVVCFCKFKNIPDLIHAPVVNEEQFREITKGNIAILSKWSNPFYGELKSPLLTIPNAEDSDYAHFTIIGKIVDFENVMVSELLKYKRVLMNIFSKDLFLELASSIRREVKVVTHELIKLRPLKSCQISNAEYKNEYGYLQNSIIMKVSRCVVDEIHGMVGDLLNIYSQMAPDSSFTEWKKFIVSFEHKISSCGNEYNLTRYHREDIKCGMIEKLNI